MEQDIGADGGAAVVPRVAQHYVEAREGMSLHPVFDVDARNLFVRGAQSVDTNRCILEDEGVARLGESRLGELGLGTFVARTQNILPRCEPWLDVVGMVRPLPEALNADLPTLGDIAGMRELSLVGSKEGQFTHRSNEPHVRDC
jgi:hypothetical protein